MKKTNKKVVVKKVSKSFNNSNGSKKQIARIAMVEAIKNSITTKKEILSLPFETCAIERMILDRVSKRFTFTGAETDTVVYNNMLKTIIQYNLPISVHRGAISKLIYEATENKYSHLILDYCGQLNSFAKEIEYAIKNNIVEVDGIIAITLAKRISIGCEGIVELMEKLNPQPANCTKTRTEHALCTFINRIGGFNYAIDLTVNYHDTAPMILMIVRRLS